ncbi:MAG: hypothetical protein OEY64_10625 [Nitrospinota bacterium]|nr:hypothetical protein [Nitrospinota bacterium]
MPINTILRLSINPVVGASQRVSLLLNEFNAPAEPKSYNITIPPRDSDLGILDFPVDNVPPGEYLVRIQVDGAESLLGIDSNPASATYNYYASPLVRFV